MHILIVPEQVIGHNVTDESLNKISSKSTEHDATRLSLKHKGEEIAREMATWHEDTWLEFFFPPRLDLNTELPISTTKIILKGSYSLNLLYIRKSFITEFTPRRF